MHVQLVGYGILYVKRNAINVSHPHFENAASCAPLDPQSCAPNFDGHAAIVRVRNCAECAVIAKVRHLFSQARCNL